MSTCKAVITWSDTVRTERVRGFQPPWHTVLILRCPSCGAEHRIRQNWRGDPPRGGFRCNASFKEDE